MDKMKVAFILSFLMVFFDYVVTLIGIGLGWSEGNGFILYFVKFFGLNMSLFLSFLVSEIIILFLFFVYYKGKSAHASIINKRIIEIGIYFIIISRFAVVFTWLGIINVLMYYGG